MVENPPVNAGDAGDQDLLPRSGRTPGVGSGNPLQYSCLENSMDRGVWRFTDHGVAKSQTQRTTHTCTMTIIYTTGKSFPTTYLGQTWGLGQKVEK